MGVASLEILRDLSIGLGIILSLISLLNLYHGFKKKYFKKIIEEFTQDLIEVNRQQNSDIEKIKEITERIPQDLELLKDAERQQLRNSIKNIYYKYVNEKRIPIYERKTADAMYILYSEGLHSNSFITLLYKEICKWEIDSTTNKDFIDLDN